MTSVLFAEAVERREKLRKLDASAIRIEDRCIAFAAARGNGERFSAIAAADGSGQSRAWSSGRSMCK